ncbi:hypothetical protein GJ629_04000 [Halapricum sp. CBA1109]|uniref:hypothetical protein n=1 Tax=Halapricum sp. CBA1109 TaxID=2668068 RepID=UPI0012FB3B43|nr:hypothetical protein [Halapricum sp. CBA1109]MUV89161.1 hypothetical protein [Halapricum sp. CBA1109]
MSLHSADATVSTTRRGAVSLLAGAAVGLSGCGLLEGSGPDVAVFNRRESTLDVTLVVGDTEQTIVSTTETLDPGEGFGRGRGDLLPSSGSVTVSVGVPGGPSAERELAVADDTAVRIRIEPDGVTFETD